MRAGVRRKKFRLIFTRPSPDGHKARAPQFCQVFLPIFSKKNFYFFYVFYLTSILQSGIIVLSVRERNPSEKKQKKYFEKSIEKRLTTSPLI